MPCVHPRESRYLPEREGGGPGRRSARVLGRYRGGREPSDGLAPAAIPTGSEGPSEEVLELAVVMRTFPPTRNPRVLPCGAGTPRSSKASALVLMGSPMSFGEARIVHPAARVEGDLGSEHLAGFAEQRSVPRDGRHDDHVHRSDVGGDVRDGGVPWLQRIAVERAGGGEQRDHVLGAGRGACGQSGGGDRGTDGGVLRDRSVGLGDRGDAGPGGGGAVACWRYRVRRREEP